MILEEQKMRMQIARDLTVLAAAFVARGSEFPATAARKTYEDIMTIARRADLP